MQTGFSKNNLFLLVFHVLYLLLQQFGPILDVEIIFNERGSKVCTIPLQHTYLYLSLSLKKKKIIVNDTCRASYVAIKKREYRACSVFGDTRARWTLAYIVVSLCDNTWNKDQFVWVSLCAGGDRKKYEVVSRKVKSLLKTAKKVLFVSFFWEIQIELFYFWCLSISNQQKKCLFRCICKVSEILKLTISFPLL